MSKVVLIAGIPGVGKSTIAIALANIFGIDNIIPTDLVRETLRSVNTQFNPILFSTTHESWKYFGAKTKKNIIKGLIAHSRLLYSSLTHLIKKAEKEGRDTIIEGVHLIPEFLDSLDTKSELYYFLLNIDSHNEHIKRFDLKNRKREVFHEIWYSNFKIMQVINQWLTQEAQKRNLLILENSSFFDTITQIRFILKNEIPYVK